jgi:S1-C subfamily serine protease/pSer/pThr/pTyr-binding forkhead associated (FHA) protein
MRIELRILSGARAGQTEVFDQPTILIGRKPSSDLRFDTHLDLDVSAMHGEILERGGRFYVADHRSTNGTFVNGQPVKAETEIKDGDLIAFGENGPTVEVRAKGDPTGKTRAIPRTGPSKMVKPPVHSNMSTHERVAVAVKEQTRGMKTMLVGSMIGLGALAIAAYWFGHKEASLQVAELTRLVAQTDSTTNALRIRTRARDTSFANALRRHSDSLRTKVQTTAARGDETELAALKLELEKSRATQQGLATLDFSSIPAKNDNAIAFLVSELDGTLYGGTAFAVTRSGLMVTNAHNVRSATGAAPTRLEIQFANTATRLPARVVKVSEDSTEDLALIQIVGKGGDYPTVAGVSGSGDVKVGSPLVTIGFPLSLGLAQQGNIVKTTLVAGPASKHIPTLLQVDSYGTHGSSGAPVFDIRGYVVGVVWGGPPNGEARVVYAVPSDRLVAFMGDVAPGIIR